MLVPEDDACTELPVVLRLKSQILNTACKQPALCGPLAWLPPLLLFFRHHALTSLCTFGCPNYNAVFLSSVNSDSSFNSQHKDCLLAGDP